VATSEPNRYFNPYSYVELIITVDHS
nr:RecName: Full=Zinc metalloproteinase-disintegrin-like daborhagin-M; AltName: Full=Snake venom metalloproteinase; Short=SVMP [Daboia siamensis]